MYQSKKNNSHKDIKDIKDINYLLSKKQIVGRLASYDFKEVLDILKFMDILCDDYPCSCDYAYIRHKLSACLKSNDDCGNDFIPLRELACELDFLYDKVNL